MPKITLFILFLTSSLLAQNATDEQLNSIYREAILFVSIFGVMGLVSYIYSSRHAKAYKPKEKEKEEEPVINRSTQLYDMLANKLLTQEEFDILKTHYETKS